MPLPQDITPFNGSTVDFLARSGKNDWIPLPDDPERGSFRLLWTGEETGQSALMFRWRKGYTAPTHKHLGASHTFVLKGRIEVRDGMLEAGDYVYEPDGVLHQKSEALEDTEFLFIIAGALIYFDDDHFLGYVNWETFLQWKEEYLAINKSQINTVVCSSH